MLIQSQYSSEKQHIQSDPIFLGIYELNCAWLHHPVNVILSFLWSNYYGTGLVWLLFPFKVSLQVISVLKKDASYYGHQVHHSTFTMQDPPSHTDSHFYHHHCLKSHGETSPLSIPSETSNVRAKGMIPMAPQSFQTLAKNGLPFLRHKLSKLPMDADRCQGKNEGFVLKRRCAQSNEPKVTSSSHICPPKEVLGGFTPL